mmetsp:Transcript_1682/g.5485  ORF Transcript_1682/g.5485 Transcript_1682/m.5485 type:complete len:414 (+) Transcript_1682:356-1597(+)
MWELQPGRTPSHAASECDAQLAYRFNQALQAHEPLAVVGPVLRGEMQVQRLCRLRIPRAESLAEFLQLLKGAQRDRPISKLLEENHQSLLRVLQPPLVRALELVGAAPGHQTLNCGDDTRGVVARLGRRGWRRWRPGGRRWRMRLGLPIPRRQRLVRRLGGRLVLVWRRRRRRRCRRVGRRRCRERSGWGRSGSRWRLVGVGRGGRRRRGRGVAIPTLCHLCAVGTRSRGRWRRGRRSRLVGGGRLRSVRVRRRRRRAVAVADARGAIATARRRCRRGVGVCIASLRIATAAVGVRGCGRGAVLRICSVGRPVVYPVVYLLLLPVVRLLLLLPIVAIMPDGRASLVHVHLIERDGRWRLQKAGICTVDAVHQHGGRILPLCSGRQLHEVPYSLVQAALCGEQLRKGGQLVRHQ